MPLSPASEPVAFVFPGQGPQDATMLEGDAADLCFREHYARLCEVAGEDVCARAAAEGAAYLRRNEIASIVTMFRSALERERLEQRGMQCVATAGYSVGQFSAMSAAGMLDLDTAMRLVWKRAELMNQTEAVADGAMLAVIGLETERVAAVCDEVAASGDFVAISNFNCLGQLTLAGTRRGIGRAQEALAVLSPRKLAPVEVSGAWHCRLLLPAADAFRAALEEVRFATPRVRVMDNVTGEELPGEPASLRDTLARHLCAPVRWEACVKGLAARGVEHFVEVGHGDMLSKFGFFIDRRRKHTPSARIP
jgi:[acyl-carrier-protein] S-malonyltransferase